MTTKLPEAPERVTLRMDSQWKGWEIYISQPVPPGGTTYEYIRETPLTKAAGEMLAYLEAIARGLSVNGRIDIGNLRKMIARAKGEQQEVQGE